MKRSERLAKEIVQAEERLAKLRADMASPNKEKRALERKLRRLKSSFWQALQAEKGYVPPD